MCVCVCVSCLFVLKFTDEHINASEKLEMNTCHLIESKGLSTGQIVLNYRVTGKVHEKYNGLYTL